MGNITLNDMERKFNNGVPFVDVTLKGRGNPQLNLLKHCNEPSCLSSLCLLGSLVDVRRMYDKFRSLSKGRNYKYVNKKALNEILPFGITTNCRIYDYFNTKGARKRDSLSFLPRQN